MVAVEWLVVLVAVSVEQLDVVPVSLLWLEDVREKDQEFPSASVHTMGMRKGVYCTSVAC
jgi:hypothetical protein